MNSAEILSEFVKKNASTILRIGAVVGVGVSNILTARATMKVSDEIRGNEMTTKEKIKTAAPHYIPSLVAGGLTAACIIGSGKLSNKQIAAYAGALALSENIHKEYKQAVIDEVGEEKEKEITSKIDERKFKTIMEKDVDFFETEGLIYFIDGLSEDGFYATREKVDKAIYKLNRKLSLGYVVTLNSFRRDLGLDPIECGSVVGWSKLNDYNDDIDEWVDFRLVPCETADWCTYISYLNMPHGLGISPAEEREAIRHTFKDKEYQGQWI